MHPLFHGNKFIADFKGKGDFFNTRFTKQSALMSNNSVLSKHLLQQTNKSLDSIIPWLANQNSFAPTDFLWEKKKKLMLFLR